MLGQEGVSPAVSSRKLTVDCPLDFGLNIWRERDANGQFSDVVLQEHDLTLVRSAVTLTVSGELDEPDPDELEDDEDDEDDEEMETYELLVSFMVDAEECGLDIPLDPFLLLVRMVDGQAVLLSDDELDRVQPLIEAELEEREWPD